MCNVLKSFASLQKFGNSRDVGGLFQLFKLFEQSINYIKILHNQNDYNLTMKSNSNANRKLSTEDLFKIRKKQRTISQEQKIKKQKLDEQTKNILVKYSKLTSPIRNLGKAEETNSTKSMKSKPKKGENNNENMKQPDPIKIDHHIFNSSDHQIKQIFKDQILYVQVQLYEADISNNFKKLIEDRGAVVRKIFQKNITKVITNLTNFKHAQKAAEWNIPIIKLLWITQSIEQQTKLPYEKYLLKKLQLKQSINRGDKKKDSLREKQKNLEDNLMYKNLMVLMKQKIKKTPEEFHINQLKQNNNHKQILTFQNVKIDLRKMEKQSKSSQNTFRSVENQKQQIHLNESKRSLRYKSRVMKSLSHDTDEQQNWNSNKPLLVYADSKSLINKIKQLQHLSNLKYLESVENCDIIIRSKDCKKYNILYGMFNDKIIIREQWLEQCEKQQNTKEYKSYQQIFRRSVPPKLKERFFKLDIAELEKSLIKKIVKNLGGQVVLDNEHKVEIVTEHMQKYKKDYKNIIRGKQEFYNSIIDFYRQD